jgi:hypothetical protein
VWEYTTCAVELVWLSINPAFGVSIISEIISLGAAIDPADRKAELAL